MARIDPVTAPFDDTAGPLLATMMPSDAEPIALFRTLVRNPTMSAAMGHWGRYELGRDLSLSRREREIVILRTCARCACEYEWGVHVAVYAERVGLDRDQVASLTHGSPADACWTDPAEAALVAAADQLHDTSHLDDDAWSALAATRSTEQRLDLLFLAGWYHAISYAANGAQVDHETWAPRFADYAPEPSSS
ncbi:MAG TPA: carboxymuconolactone decarboxylase family protein [Acidimicrobiales bacterium]|nr:carboxymuconolactone decarboxylase family protein [Acidimicrobiales bacterium]